MKHDFDIYKSTSIAVLGGFLFTCVWACSMGLACANDDVPALQLTLKESLLMALENNVGFQIDRIQPKMTQAEEEIQQAEFDPVLSASIEGTRERDNSGDTDTRALSANAGVDKSFATGTDLALDINPGITKVTNEDETETKEVGISATVTQKLLQGYGSEVNLVRLRQARMATQMSFYELRGAAETLVAQTEQTFWEYILAERSIAIYQKSLEVAEQQLDEVKERILVGKLAETEIAAVEAEKANRLEQLINARAELLKKRLQLIRLLKSNADDDAWDREVILMDTPEMEPIKLENLKTSIQSALKSRADLCQARLLVQKNDLEIVRTRNGLLPKLDFFLSLGGSHYTNSFSNQADTKGEDINLTAGLTFEWPYENRASRALHQKARFSLEQSQLALKNMEQLVQLDVRSAFVDVNRLEQQIKATQATRDAREKTLSIEQEKFRVGKSTSFLVSQAQRDLVASEIEQVKAIVEYRNALLTFYRMDGSLLQRRGIETFTGDRTE